MILFASKEGDVGEGKEKGFFPWEKQGVLCEAWWTCYRKPTQTAYKILRLMKWIIDATNGGHYSQYLAKSMLDLKKPSIPNSVQQEKETD